MDSTILGLILDSSEIIAVELAGKISAESAVRGVTIPFAEFLPETRATSTKFLV
jgi:hypothetical protein